MMEIQYAEYHREELVVMLGEAVGFVPTPRNRRVGQFNPKQLRKICDGLGIPYSENDGTAELNRRIRDRMEFSDRTADLQWGSLSKDEIKEVCRAVGVDL